MSSQTSPRANAPGLDLAALDVTELDATELDATAAELPVPVGGRAGEPTHLGSRSASRSRSISQSGSVSHWRESRSQVLVMAGQGFAGLGNAVFSLMAARLLSPKAFSELAAFLALYLVISLPSNGLSALAALGPRGAGRLGRIATGIGISAGLVFAAGSIPLASLLGIPVVLVLCLALACPVTPLLALARGRLYGVERHGSVVVSLLAEPTVRITAGLGLAGVLGAAGAGFGVVLAGVAALEVALRLGRTGAHAGRNRPAQALQREAGQREGVSAAANLGLLATLMFLVLGISQNLDLLMSNRLLGAAAPSYAALSTLGGIVAFATATVPLVFVPKAGRDRGALSVALVVAGLAGLGGILVVLPDPGLVVRALVGARYENIAPYLTLYFTAMAFLGLARVLVVHNLALGRGRSALALSVAAVAGQAVAIVLVPRTVGAVADTTVTTMAALALAEAGVALPGTEVWSRARAWLSTPVGRTLTAATVVGFAVRLYIPRGFWLDEATSIFEARMTFPHMISQLYYHDVHPPLYFSILWVDIRLLGSGQLGVRFCSVVFGLLIVPMAYVAGRDLFDRRTGLVAALVSVVSPLMVWYSQEARMYSMFMLFALVAVWAQGMALREGRRRYWVAWVLASAALGWTEYFGLFLVAVQVLIFLILMFHWRHEERGRRLLRQGFVAGVALALLLAPALLFAYHQFVVNQDAGKGFGGPSQVGAGATGTATGVSVYTVLANVIWSLVGYQSNPTMADLGALWPIGILACLVVLGRRHRGETKLVVACALGPLALDVLLASKKPTLLDVRYISGLAPLLALLTARVITGTTRRAGSMIVCSTLTIALLVAGLVDQQSNGSNPRRYDFQRALQRIDAEHHPGDVLVYDPSDLNQVVGYYAPHVDSHPLNSTEGSPRPGHALYVLATRSLMNDSSDPEDLAQLLRHLERDDHLVERFTVPNVQVWEFRR